MNKEENKGRKVILKKIMTFFVLMFLYTAPVIIMVEITRRALNDNRFSIENFILLIAGTFILILANSGADKLINKFLDKLFPNKKGDLTKEEYLELKTLSERMMLLMKKKSVVSSSTEIKDINHGLICKTDVGYFEEGLESIVGSIKVGKEK